MANPNKSLQSVRGIYVDKRSDTTRTIGSKMPKSAYGAANTFVGAGPLDALLNYNSHTDPRSDFYNPFLQTGVTPIPGKVGKIGKVGNGSKLVLGKNGKYYNINGGKITPIEKLESEVGTNISNMYGLTKKDWNKIWRAESLLDDLDYELMSQRTLW